MKEWFFGKDGLVAAILFWVMAPLYLLLGLREHHAFDFILALLALVVGFANYVRYLKK